MRSVVAQERLVSLKHFHMPMKLDSYSNLKMPCSTFEISEIIMKAVTNILESASGHYESGDIYHSSR